MSVAGLVVVVATSLVLLGLVLNHVHARLALIELTLNEGLPPGHEAPTQSFHGGLTAVDPIPVLGPGVHVFLSRNCHACQRLIEALAETTLELGAELHLRYVDRPRPLAASVARTQHATLHDHEAELSDHIGADPLPYTIAVGSHALVGRSVTPTVRLVLETARNAGISAEVQAGNVSLDSAGTST